MILYFCSFVLCRMKTLWGEGGQAVRYQGFIGDRLRYTQDHLRLYETTLPIPDHCAIFPGLYGV